MSDDKRKECKGKDVTAKVKRYLKLYKTSGNINIKTIPSKKKLKTVKKKKNKKKVVEGGWQNKQKGGFKSWGAVTAVQQGGWGHKVKL